MANKMERSISSGRSRRDRSTLATILVVLIIVAFITRWLDLSIMAGLIMEKQLRLLHPPFLYSTAFDCSHNCSDIPSFIPTKTIGSSSSESSCPEYFKWIHEDLKPWKAAGITRDMVEGAKNVAHVRITILNGKLYTVKYKKAFQTREVISIWGLLQLLRLYPGKLPNMDLMFELGDEPVIQKNKYSGQNTSVPPPVFHYCGNESSYSIVFPDWSFWGWPEVNIKPWEELKVELKEANKRIDWKDREPYAYWRGNTKIGNARRDLVKCNASDGQEHWLARIYDTAWKEERKQGFNNSDLTSQCTHRYKIYVEGVSWSVSRKYISACDSMTLVIKSHYHDFFTRGLVPSIHYWPIREENKCGAINFAVEWGNGHRDEAREIGRAGSRFVLEKLAMKNIYDYSFHVLNEYAKLLKYEPTIPEGAVETCVDSLVCASKGRKRRFLKQSMVRSPADVGPCTLPRPYVPADLVSLLQRKEELANRVRLWEETERHVMSIER